MNDATVSWTRSLTGTPTGYIVTWSRGGTPLPSILIPASSAQDSTGYSSDFVTATGIVLSPGDVLGATVQAFDSVNNLKSSVVVSSPPTVTIPIVLVAPGDPQNVKLVLS
jgi:hypothetical protein